MNYYYQVNKSLFKILRGKIIFTIKNIELKLKFLVNY